MIVFSSLESKGQELTFVDLKYLLEHNVEDADTYITKKNYKYHEAQKGENGKCDAMLWSSERDTENNSAVAFISKYCYQENVGFIWYQLGDKDIFDKIKNYCKSIGFSLTKTETNPLKKLCVTFKDKKYTIEFCSGLNESTNLNSYTITFNLN